MLTHENMEQIAHVARMAVLAMCARGVAASEFETTPEVQQLRIIVHRPIDGEQPAIDLEFMGTHAIPLGGLSL